MAVLICIACAGVEHIKWRKFQPNEKGEVKFESKVDAWDDGEVFPDAIACYNLLSACALYPAIAAAAMHRWRSPASALWDAATALYCKDACVCC